MEFVKMDMYGFAEDGSGRKNRGKYWRSPSRYHEFNYMGYCVKDLSVDELRNLGYVDFVQVQGKGCRKEMEGKVFISKNGKYKGCFYRVEQFNSGCKWNCKKIYMKPAGI